MSAHAPVMRPDAVESKDPNRRGPRQIIPVRPAPDRT